MSLIVKLLSTYAVSLKRLVFNANPFRHHGMLQPCAVSISENLISRKEENMPRSLSDIIGDIFLMAAPKSKVSHARKKRKHLRYIPEPKQWLTCKKCGEPKLPHRICKEHLDVCAMRDSEWEAKLKADAAAKLSN